MFKSDFQKSKKTRKRNPRYKDNNNVTEIHTGKHLVELNELLKNEISMSDAIVDDLEMMFEMLQSSLKPKTKLRRIVRKFLII